MLRKAMLPNAKLLQLEPAGSKHSDVRGKYPSKLKVCNSTNQAPPGWERWALKSNCRYMQSYDVRRALHS